MKTSTLFSVNAVVATVFGLGFLLVPVTVLSLYAVEVPDAGIFIARLLGAAFLSFGIISWLVRNSGGSSEGRAVILAFAAGDLIGFVVSLIYQLQGVANGLGWSTVAIYLLLGLGFAISYMKK